MQYNIDLFEQAISDRLNKKRLSHSFNVADSAKDLALLNHYDDPEKAYVAGLLHDICKNDNEQTQIEMVRKSNRAVNAIDLLTPQLYHAIAGAWYIEQNLGVRDEEILDAIRYHTEGRARMTLLDKIIFVADIISADRDFDDVDYYRNLAKTDLDRTVLEYLHFSIKDVLDKNICLSTHSVNAYNWELQLYNTRNK